MKTTKRIFLVAWCLCILAVGTVWTQTNNTGAAPSELNITVGEQRLKFAPTKSFLEMRLNVFNSQGELVYGAATSEAEMQWLVKNNNNEALLPGLYAYVLTLKYGENDERIHRGHFVIEKGQDQLWLTAENNTEISGTALNVTRSGGRSLAGLNDADSQAKRDVNDRGLVDEKGNKVADDKKLSKQGKSALLGSFQRVAKFGVGGLADTDSIIFDDGTNVGVDTTTPQAKLQVANGSIMPTNGNAMDRGIQFPSDPGGGSGDKAYLRYYATSGETTKLAIGVEDNFDDTLGFFQAGAERMTVHNGNVGIGTTIPNAKLSVSANTVAPPTTPGIVGYFANTDENNTFITADSYGNGPWHSDFLFRRARGTMAAPAAVQNDDIIGQIQARGYGATGFATTSRAGIRMTAAQNWSDSDQGAFLSFLTTPNGSNAINTERMRITDAGRVGIGTSNPGYTLEAVGANEIFSGGSGAGFKFRDRVTTNEWSIYGLNDNFRFFNSIGGIIIGITPTGTIFPYNGQIPNNPEGMQDLGTESFKWRNLWLSSGVFNGSDMRLKNHITGLNYGLKSVMKLRPVSYTWKNSSDPKLNLGLLAQEVEQVVPEVVHRSSEPDQMMSINYISLVPVLIKAVQEQQTMIEKKEAQLNRLQKRVNALEKRSKRSR